MRSIFSSALQGWRNCSTGGPEISMITQLEFLTISMVSSVLKTKLMVSISISQSFYARVSDNSDHSFNPTLVLEYQSTLIAGYPSTRVPIPIICKEENSHHTSLLTAHIDTRLLVSNFSWTSHQSIILHIWYPAIDIDPYDVDTIDIAIGTYAGIHTSIRVLSISIVFQNGLLLRYR